MNKYQEALNFLDWHCEVTHQEQQDILQELIDKETPMKPIDGKWCKCGKPTELNPSFGDYGVYRTPRCECGQVIDWKD